MSKQYICTRDLQGGSFGVGRIGDIEYWRDTALEWARQDDADGLIEYLENAPCDHIDTLNFIRETWELEIVERKPRMWLNEQDFLATKKSIAWAKSRIKELEKENNIVMVCVYQNSLREDYNRLYGKTLYINNRD